jgi:hypothetical protein
MGHTMAVALAGGACLTLHIGERRVGTLDEGATTAYQPSSPVRPTLSELADGARLSWQAVATPPPHRSVLLVVPSGRAAGRRSSPH